MKLRNLIIAAAGLAMAAGGAGAASAATTVWQHDHPRRVEVNLEELDRVLDGAREAPLSEQDHHKLREALHALAAMLVRPRNTEKTSFVVEKPQASGDKQERQDDSTRSGNAMG